jgi:hypothetical protein
LRPSLFGHSGCAPAARVWVSHPFYVCSWLLPPAHTLFVGYRQHHRALAARGEDVTLEAARGENITLEAARGEDVTLEVARGEDVTLEAARGEDITLEAARGGKGHAIAARAVAAGRWAGATSSV